MEYGEGVRPCRCTPSRGEVSTVLYQLKQMEVEIGCSMSPIPTATTTITTSPNFDIRLPNSGQAT
jgi:hypothetical protein